MRDDLPQKPNRNECGIINLDTTKGPGTHWVAYKKHGRRAEYYDSFGNLRPPPELQKYLKNTLLTYNYETQQSPNTWNCGHLCLAYLTE